MNSFAFYIALAAVAGALLPLQAVINAHLGASVNAPILATFVNFAVGTVLLFLVLCALRLPLPAFGQLSAMPWWSWLGGFLGAFFVLTATLTVPKLGTAGLAAIVIAGQLMSSIILDHFGVLNHQQPVSALRLLGAAMLIAGAALILRPEA